MKDYYHGEGEAPGVWSGSVAKTLDLNGEVKEPEMSNLWNGYSPDGLEKMVQNAGAENRRKAGWDTSYSAPKGFSMIWGITQDEKLRAQLEQAHNDAVKDAQKYVEENAGYTRRGRGGAEHEKTSLLFANFQHGTSRNGDLQLHTHGLTFNSTVRDDGTTGSIESKYLFQSKMSAGAVYRASLATRAEGLGFEIEKDDKGLFDIKGISEQSKAEFSTRTGEIEKYIQEKGLQDTAQNRDKAAVATRANKQNLTPEQYRSNWQERGAKHGITSESIKELQGKAKVISEFERHKNRELVREQALAKVTHHHSTFREFQLDRAIAEESIGMGFTYSDMKAVKQGFLKSREAVEIYDGSGSNINRQFTTMRQLDLEQELKDRTAYLSENRSHSVGSEEIFKAIQRRPTMSQEQKKALTHVTADGGIKVVSGRAGTGKSYFLGAANEVWQGSEYQVQGLALSGKAASGLEDGSGIKSRTIDSFFASIDRQRETGSESGGQWPSILNAKTVLVVDEAGMIDTKRMTRLLAEADEAGSKVVLVGDAKQLQSIESGGAFASIAKNVGEVELTEIRRQREEWNKKAINDLAQGRAREAIDAFDARGLITVRNSSNKLYGELIKDWSAHGAVERPENHLILANTNREVDALNEIAQQKRREAGKLGDRKTFVNERTVYENDRLLFLENSRELNVKNGMLGTVNTIDHLKKQLTVTLDNKEQRTFSHNDYDKLSLAYAVTNHKAQGITIEQNAYVVTGGRLQDREASYVQMSRAKEQTRIYAQADSRPLQK